jgi:signal transduction histidine kinase
LEEVGSAMAVCSPDGNVVASSPSARAVFARTGCGLAERLPAPLPATLWRLLAETPAGEAVQWHGATDNPFLLGCTRYRLGQDAWLLVMSEIAEKQRAWSRQIHQQRIDLLGRLLASVVHDLRSPLTSLVYNSDFLVDRYGDAIPAAARETLGDLQLAAQRLRDSIDSLLDFVRLGPPVASEVVLADVLGRVVTLLRPLFRAGAHRFHSAIADDAQHLQGNALILEQIFLHLVLNAVDTAPRPVTVAVTGERTVVRGRDFLRITVEDDGPAIPDEDRAHIFNPFVASKQHRSSVGLSSAREAARALDGDIELVRSAGGAAFAVLVPSAREAHPT